jgi:hypothetical protein
MGLLSYALFWLHFILLDCEDGTAERSETFEFKLQTAENNPEESCDMQHTATV